MPGPNTIRYGGNTACVEIILSDSTKLIMDAGTGIRKLGDKLTLENQTKPINLFLTHAHWDHIQGFPFFHPAHLKDFTIKFYGSAPYFSRLWDILRKQMESEYFPVNFDALSAKLEFNVVTKSQIQVGPALVTYSLLNHPGGCTAFKITEQDKSLIFMTDNELSAPHPTISKEQLTEFCRNTDLLIHDAQFTPRELAQKPGWGHSSYTEALQLAIDAQAKTLALFHHDPDRSDQQVDDILKDCQLKLEKEKCPLKVLAAAEGAVIEI